MLDDKFPTPGDNFELQIPALFIRESLTIWPSMTIRVVNAPTMVTNPPPTARPGAGVHKGICTQSCREITIINNCDEKMYNKTNRHVKPRTACEHKK